MATRQRLRSDVRFLQGRAQRLVTGLSCEIGMFTWVVFSATLFFLVQFFWHFCRRFSLVLPACVGQQFTSAHCTRRLPVRTVSTVCHTESECRKPRCECVAHTTHAMQLGPTGSWLGDGRVTRYCIIFFFSCSVTRIGEFDSELAASYTQ
jgi:hypothetical protein